MTAPDEQTIFNEARRIDDRLARKAYLDTACAGDSLLRQRVESLLGVHEEQASFLNAPAISADTLDPPSELSLTTPGTLIGRYKILEPIGEGGYGAVFMAEQTSPISRKVALKIIKAGMDTRQVIARFEAERQALALMDHPNIARVFDGGVAETGRPYFVMELVKGTSIIRYCDEHRLTPKQRLELFIQVCQAVQHAHQKGIIHRDLKPTNVLVAQYDGTPVPKVIDFGIAKATGQRLTERTMFTGFGDVIGTPQYMSPEQAEMNQLDVDTRSDVYSLGVLLYELLTGTTPLESKRLKQAALLEVLRVIREEEPPKPSTRLSTSEQLPSIAINRGLEPKKLSGMLHGELDWIVMRALEKDRTRRYETASGFAADVRRYLDDEPVLACPPSAAYRFWKFARRHKTALLATSTAFAALLLTVVGLVVINRAISRERSQKIEALAEAQLQAKRAQDNFSRASVAIRELMTNTAMGFDDVHPAVRKRFSDAALRYYQNVIQNGAADPSLRYETAVGYRSLADVHGSWGDAQLAEKCFRQSKEILERLAAEHPADALYRQQLGFTCLSYGWLLREMRRLDDGETVLRQGEAIYERLLVESPQSFVYSNELALLLRHLTGLYSVAGKPDDAKRASTRAAELLTRIAEHRDELEPHAPATEQSKASAWSSIGAVKRHLGIALHHARRDGEAEQAFREAAAVLERARDTDPSTAQYWHFLADSHRLIGQIELAQGHVSEAEVAYRRAVDLHSERARRFSGEKALFNSEWFASYYELANLLVSNGRFDDARKVYRDAISLCDPPSTGKQPSQSTWRHTDRERESPEFTVADLHHGLGIVEYRTRNWSAALAAFQQSNQLREPDDASDALFLAMANWHLGNQDEARRWYAVAVQWIEKNRDRLEKDPGKAEFDALRAEAAEHEQQLSAPSP